MTKTEQKELATARQYAATWPQYAARTISVMRRCTRRNATLDATLAAIAKIRAAINVGVMFCFLSIIGFCALLMFDAALAALIVGAVLAAIDYTL